MKVYRQSSHAISLCFWALLCLGAAVVLFLHSRRVLDRTLRLEEVAAGAGLLVIGPADFAVYLVRARKVGVAVDVARGLRVGDGRWILWDDIVRFERRKPWFRKSTGPATLPAVPAMDPSGGGPPPTDVSRSGAGRSSGT